MLCVIAAWQLTLCDEVQAGLVAAEEARQRLLESLCWRVGRG